MLYYVLNFKKFFSQCSLDIFERIGRRFLKSILVSGSEIETLGSQWFGSVVDNVNGFDIDYEYDEVDLNGNPEVPLPMLGGMLHYGRPREIDVEFRNLHPNDLDMFTVIQRVCQASNSPIIETCTFVSAHVLRADDPKSTNVIGLSGKWSSPHHLPIMKFFQMLNTSSLSDLPPKHQSLAEKVRSGHLILSNSYSTVGVSIAQAIFAELSDDIRDDLADWQPLLPVAYQVLPMDSTSL